MCRKFILFCALVLALFISVPSWADIVYDDFNTPHNYLADGVGGTVWDGLVSGFENGEGVTAINADINEPNSLYLGSINGHWEPDFDPYGPFLYKNVKSDNWIMVTRVSNYPLGVFWNLFGIMARASMDPDEAGPGEDSEQVGHFEVTVAANVQAMNDGAQVADLSVGMLAPYLRLRQITEVNELGDVNTVIYHEISFDGKDWTVHPISPRLRNDFTGLTLQLGLHHAVYTDDTFGWGAYGEVLILYRGEGQAWYESPEYNSTNVDLEPTLVWLSGPYVKTPQGHEVYISDDISKVEGRDVAVRTITDTNSHTVASSLDIDTVYYWCVDEVNDACAPGEWEGDIWSFTTNTGKAYDPVPYDEQGGVPDTTEQLQWTANQYAVTQDFFFGEDKATVEAMTTPTVADISSDVNYVVLADAGITLLPANTYYWRIDSDCGALGTAKGDVWSFLTAYPYSICDDFEEDHEYFADEVAGTIWDGVMGLWDYCFTMDTITTDGALRIESIGASWAGAATGVLLYKEVVGDFTARVTISDFLGLFVDRGSAVGTNNAGIMARVSDPDLAGPGEDWISLDFFTGWGVGNIIRDNNGVRRELGNEGTGWDGDRWLQIERRGIEFYLSHSPDGGTYTQSPASPVARPDMEGLSLQVGPQHSTFGGGSAWAEYDDFCLERNAIEKAYAPRPASGAMMDRMDGVVSWTTGDFAVDHRVYFSSDFNDVNNRVEDANRGTDKEVPEGGGRFSYDAGYYEPSPLVVGQTYWWAIDEINDPCIWSGDPWRFTIQDYSLIDNFEPYTSTGKAAGTPPAGTLRKVWVCGNSKWTLYGGVATSGSCVQLNTDTYDGATSYPHYVLDDEDIAQSGAQSMKFYYDNDGTCTYEIDLYNGYPPDLYTYTPSPDTYLSEAYAATDDAAAESGRTGLGLKRDWSIYKVIRLSFYGDPNNGEEPMYVGLKDADGTLVTLDYPVSSDIMEPWWHDWYIALSEFTDKNAGLDLEHIVRIYIGFGDKDSPSSGGSGVVFFDDILLYATPQCVPGSVFCDLDDDCVIDNADLEIFTYQFPGETPTLPTPIIELVATGTVGNDVTSWSNTGSLHGTFTDVNATDANNPVVDMVLGKKCVTFDNLANALVWDQNAPATLTSDTNEPNDFTVIYEVYNPSIADEEYVFNWARRGGPTGTCGGVAYGSNAAYGAIIHWDAPDMGFDLGVPQVGQWHVIAATYDGTTEAVIVDGLVHGLEDKDIIVRMDLPVTVGAPYQLAADSNDAYVKGLYVPTYDLRFTGSIASIRVYADAVPPGDLAIVTATMAGLSRAEADFKPDSRIDFGDLAVMGDRWLQEELIAAD